VIGGPARERLAPALVAVLLAAGCVPTWAWMIYMLDNGRCVPNCGPGGKPGPEVELGREITRGPIMRINIHPGELLSDARFETPSEHRRAYRPVRRARDCGLRGSAWSLPDGFVMRGRTLTKAAVAAGGGVVAFILALLAALRTR
jgi:hypothetical protein